MKITYVDSFPPCDICGEPAWYDCRSTLRGGKWAYLCEKDFARFGTEMGTQLRLREEITKKTPGEIDYDIDELMQQAIMDDFRCPSCGSILEVDAEKCGICGWKNVLRDFI